MASVTTAVPTALLVSGLVKTFGRTRALDGQEVAVRRGGVLGFLGPNGAGGGDGLGTRPGAGR